MAIARQSLKLLKSNFRLPVKSLIAAGDACLTFPVSQIEKKMFTTSKILSQEQIEELQKNPFFDKYAEKIAKLQKKNPEEFLARIEATAGKSQPGQAKDFSLPGAAKQSLTGEEEPAAKQKSLDSIVKLELLAQKTAPEIEEIWCNHFSHKDCVSAVIPAKTFTTMQERFAQFNTFLFPLPRDQGYEFIVVQFLGNEAHFTTLINYQAHKENAPECLNMIHYPDLAESKGIVLMVGEYDKDVLTRSEARGLVVQTIQYYGWAGLDDKKFGHLFRFTYETEDFNHLDLIQEIELDPGFPAPPA